MKNGRTKPLEKSFKDISIKIDEFKRDINETES